MKYPYMEIKNRIITFLQNRLIELGYTTSVQLEIPPGNLGDFSFPCFQLCKQSKKSPEKTAFEIADNLHTDNFIESIQLTKGYINFTINTQHLLKKTIKQIVTSKEEFGILPQTKKKIIIEHTSANPNGPFHVGRARNPIIGDTLTRLFKAAGYHCESQYYVDDLGKQVAILTWGIQHIDEKNLPSSRNDKPDHLAVRYYQKAYDLMQKKSEINHEISEIVQKSEIGNKETLSDIHNAYQPVLEGMKQSLHTINIDIDTYVPESKFVQDKSVETVIETLKDSSYCKQEDGANYLDLTSFGIQGRSKKFFFTRKDGTSLYATRDIAYHLWKAQQADILINVLGEDHKLESKQVEIGLQLCGQSQLPQTVFYSFVSLPEGKMSTRKGRVIYLDDLIDECIKRAYKEVEKRRGQELPTHKMNEIARVIGIGALRYNIIKVQPEKDIAFKWEEALNFEGNSAPFIQYAHARAAGILSKNTKNLTKQAIDTEKLNVSSEIQLVKKLSQFPDVINNSAKSFKPHFIAIYLFETASLFNQFYRDCPVLSEEDENLMLARLHVVFATKTVLHNGLNILGIEAPEEM